MTNTSTKTMVVVAAIAVLGMIAGCGGSGGKDVSAAPASSGGTATSAPTPGGTSESAVLYATNCESCHGSLAASEKLGMSLARLQNAITGNIGGMGPLAALTAAEKDLIVSALNPTPTTPPPTGVDGAALYATNCAGCHSALATSTKKNITLARLQNSISGNVGNMGFLSTLTTAQQQAIVTSLVSATTPPPPPPPTTVDGPALYAANCASCHGALATSGKKNITLARLQNSISGNVGNMGFLSTLTTAQQQAIVTALVSTTPPPPPPPPTTVDGPALYAANCASCHGPLATSAKKNATAAQIQTRMAAPPYVATALTSAQVQAIATALVSSTPPPPPPPATCGSCHALPPANGKHTFHVNRNISCASCHGSGYSTTAVNSANHNNGVKNLTTTIGWTAATRSCSNSCHGRKSW